ncbi:hypothetical protein M378DRAFT_570284 [Amanita muscaria Koide BX008]|uniref:Uncharacterized protein n=1 Tax=Amanita muscaria (strain Koide BX008) TaxID=946122 RepID=A0A0C2WGG3_AMAMK|nr:hypothetical protein M378DRAFT_570284 [Amanita muscaria Koide BX008]
MLNLQDDVAIQAQAIARILIPLNGASNIQSQQAFIKICHRESHQLSYRQPFLRVFTFACLSLLFIHRSRDHGVEDERGLKSVAPMLSTGAYHGVYCVVECF